MSVGIGKLAKSRYEHEIKLDVTQALSQGRLLYLFGLINQCLCRVIFLLKINFLDLKLIKNSLYDSLS